MNFNCRMMYSMFAFSFPKNNEYIILHSYIYPTTSYFLSHFSKVACFSVSE